MLFLHISISSARMMNTYTKMIRDNFPLEEHRFLYWDDIANDDRKLLDYGNSVELTGSEKKRRIEACRQMDEADIIIWHGLLFGARRTIVPLIYRQYMKKSIWIIRGIDLYNWRIQKSNFASKIINKINYICRKNMPRIGYIAHTDESVYRDQFGEQAKRFYLPYAIPKDAFDTMERYRDSIPRDNGKIYVQVAHNSYTFNNHEKILDDLSKFKNENIRVIVPLSYGNDWYNKEDNYVARISKKAEEIFGGKTACMKRLMPPHNYSELLCNIDISVYQSKRQNALGNILRSLYTGNKVFLSPDNPLYTLYVQNGIEIGNADEIKNMTYEEFITPVNSDAAVQWIRRNHHPDAVAVYWKLFFDECKREAGCCENFLKADNVMHEVDARLAEAFPDDCAAKERIKKKNYVDLTRYCPLPKGTVFKNIYDVAILGATHLGIELCENLVLRNKNGTVCSINGIYDDNVEMVEIKDEACDVVGCLSEMNVDENVCYLNAYEDSEEREHAAHIVLEKSGKLMTYLSSKTYLGRHVSIEDGAIFLNEVRVNDFSAIGRCSILRSSEIGCNVVIGDYCTIERSCVIYDGAKLGNHVIVSMGSKIWPGVTIKDGTVISPFSEVTMDIL